MILSAIERPDSPFIRIQYKDALGKVRRVKTNVRKNDPEKELKVAMEINKVEAQLLNATARTSGGGWQWVPGWLKAKWGAKELTLWTYESQWKRLALFLREAELHEPGSVGRQHCYDYATWRTAAPRLRNHSQRKRSINTAINELKLLGQIMDEAIVRGLATKNPARKLGIEGEEAGLKPDITDAELALIFAALKKRDVWMQRSFFLALNTGLRFATTMLDRRDVSLERNQIVIEKPKGGRKRAFAIPIYPEIADLIRKWMKSGDRYLWSLPPAELDFASLVWTKFFREIGLPHLCFHCTRVTFITRGALGGVPESMMMKMVNHASTEVHRIYQRLAAGDALRYRAQIAIPSYGGAIA